MSEENFAVDAAVGSWGLFAMFQSQPAWSKARNWVS